MDASAAVTIRNAYKKYGQGPWILKNFNMTIPKNQIYGLLGSSGCGKTTLLKSMVGAGSLDYGRIEVCVRSKKEVGFMPQETSLFEEFTIAETFHFYGQLYKLSTSEFTAKVKELSDVLDLPKKHRVCKTLSGGQVRRVSIAVTLLHTPTLIILDEPTSGLDPVLANIFWQYLNRLAVQGQTIIITTHYIEEARQATMVGLMRQGVLLAEDAPEKLITHYNVESLEDVFLCLCNQQETAVEVEPERKTPFKSPYKDDTTDYSMFWPHTRAIMFKNLKWVQRNWLVFSMLSIFLSVSCIIESNECLKYYPAMRVGVVNHGVNGACVNYDPGAFNCSNAHRVDLSCHFMRRWRQEKPDMPLITYDNMQEAMKQGKSRYLVTILEIPYNFTAGILERYEEGQNASKALIEGASMDIRLDSTDFMTVFKMEQDIRDVIGLTLKDHLKLCGYYPAVADAPPMIINKNEFLGEGVVYKPFDYAEHVAMACMCGITYLGPVIILTVSLCMEKMTGAYTRCLVGGVKVVEIFAGYLFMLMIFNLINTGSMTFFQFVVYQQPYGQFWLTYFILNFLGLSGIAFGLFTVMVTNSLSECAGICLVVSLAMYTFTGFVWPIEAAKLSIIEPVSKLMFPNTLCLKALLAILWKDAGLFSKQVLLGFGICGLHLVFYGSVIYVMARVRKGL